LRISTANFQKLGKSQSNGLPCGSGGCVFHGEDTYYLCIHLRVQGYCPHIGCH